MKEMVGDRSQKLGEPVKEQIQAMIEMLQQFKEEQIDKPDATENDALEYLPLFTIAGALLSSMMGVTYDEYLLATDYMIRILGLEENNDKEIPQKSDKTDVQQH